MRRVTRRLRPLSIGSKVTAKSLSLFAGRRHHQLIAIQRGPGTDRPAGVPLFCAELPVRFEGDARPPRRSPASFQLIRSGLCQSRSAAASSGFSLMKRSIDAARLIISSTSTAPARRFRARSRKRSAARLKSFTDWLMSSSTRLPLIRERSIA
jgi:hypothetical protein